MFGPEAEFFIFDNVQYDHKSNGTFYSVDSEEAVWNTGREEMPNLGYKIRYKEGYFPVAPTDTQQDIRSEMCLVMEAWGSRWSGSTMKWPRAGRRRSTLGLTPW